MTENVAREKTEKERKIKIRMMSDRRSCWRRRGCGWRRIRSKCSKRRRED
jgi:hypothetical protein